MYPGRSSRPQRLYDAQGEASLLLQAQAALTLLLGLCGFMPWVAVEDIWVGSGIALVSNGYFYLKLFSAQGAQQLRKMMSAFYLGQLGKWLLVIALFCFFFKVTAIDAFGTLLGYILASLLNGLVPFCNAKQRMKWAGNLK